MEVQQASLWGYPGVGMYSDRYISPTPPPPLPVLVLYDNLVVSGNCHTGE